MESPPRITVLALLVTLAGTGNAADLPAWMRHEAIAESEMHRNEIAIHCVQRNVFRPGVGACITMAQWCRMHRAMGEPVDDIVVCQPDPVFGYYGGQ